jgi:hypothetical protein
MLIKPIKRFVSKALGQANRVLAEHPAWRTRLIGVVRKFPGCEHRLRLLFAEQFRSAQGQSASSVNQPGITREMRDGFYVRVVDDNQDPDDIKPSLASPLEKGFRHYRNIK